MKKTVAARRVPNGYSPRIKRVVETCQSLYAKMPEELRVIGPRTSVLAPVPGSLNQSPCYVAAWVIWVVMQSKPPLEGDDQGVPRVVRPFVMIDSDEWPPRQLGNMDVRTAEELTEEAKKALAEFELPDPAEFFATGWEGWLSDSEGKPSLVARWGLLLATLVNLRYPLSKLPQVGGPGDHRDIEPEISGIHWWESLEEIVRLRWVIDRVREALHLADGIDADSTPTEKRWHPRAERLLRDIDSQFGSSLDVPAIGGRPRVVCRRLAPLCHGFMVQMEQLIERVREMGVALEVYRGRPLPSATANTVRVKPGEVWKPAAWFRLVVKHYTLGKARLDMSHLTRKARELAPVEWAKQATPGGPYRFEVHAVCAMPEYSGHSALFERAMREHFDPVLRNRVKPNRSNERLPS